MTRTRPQHSGAESPRRPDCGIADQSTPTRNPRRNLPIERRRGSPCHPAEALAWARLFLAIECAANVLVTGAADASAGAVIEPIGAGLAGPGSCRTFPAHPLQSLRFAVDRAQTVCRWAVDAALGERGGRCDSYTSGDRLWPQGIPSFPCPVTLSTSQKRQSRNAPSCPAGRRARAFRNVPVKRAVAGGEPRGNGLHRRDHARVVERGHLSQWQRQQVRIQLPVFHVPRKKAALLVPRALQNSAADVLRLTAPAHLRPARPEALSADDTRSPPRYRSRCGRAWQCSRRPSPWGAPLLRLHAASLRRTGEHGPRVRVRIETVQSARPPHPRRDRRPCAWRESRLSPPRPSAHAAQ